MHRHAYNQRKLSLAAGPRRALVRGLIDSLILYERIETTEAKAKTIAPIFDRLVTKAKKGDLHNYRQIMSTTLSPVAAQKLRYELAEKFQDRDSGYTRIVKTGARRGDNAPMAVIELILDQPKQKVAEKGTTKTSEQAGQKTTAKQSQATGVKE